MANNIRTLIKSSLQSDQLGLRVADLADNIGSTYQSTYQALKAMEAEGQVFKVSRGVYRLSDIPNFTTAECISLLQSLEGHEVMVEDARDELDRLEAQLQAVKNTIRLTMMTAFQD